MSRARSLAHAVRRLPTLLRTARHLRFRQALAQLHHALFGLAPPRRAPGDAPRLAISTPATPYLPPPAHVKSLGAGRFELLSTAFELPTSADWSAIPHGPLFAYHLHQHEYLRRADVPPPVRARVIADWILSHRSGIGWDPHPTGLRLLAWGKLLTTPGMLPEDEPSRSELLRSFADQAETLSANLEIRLQANHLLSNLLCVVAAGMWIDGATSADWRERSARLRAELASQIHPDGGHEERSPMYHAALLEGVLDLLNLCRAAPERAPTGLAAALAETASRMVDALELLSHGDGQPALLADCAFDVAPEASALRDYAERLGLGPQLRAAGHRPGSALLPQTGHLRLESRDWLLLASVGEPSPPHQPGHAHCDALSFELSIAGRRLVTDTGVCEYVPGERRNRSRATASHATLQIDGEEQAELWASHRVGGRPEVALTLWRSEAGEAEATCRGWSRPKVRHRRRFQVTDVAVELEDTVEGPAREIRARLPIGPGWEVELHGSRAPSDGHGAVAAGPADAGTSAGPTATCRALDGSGVVVEIALPSQFAWRIERGAYYPRFGCALDRPVLVGVASRCSAARTRLRRIG